MSKESIENLDSVRRPGDLSEVGDSVIRRALQLIWSPGHRSITVREVAEQLPITRRTLDRRFSEVVGHSVLEEIKSCRMARAVHLLKETRLPIKTVAYLAGFSSTERMRVTFVERIKQSPSAFRERVHGGKD